MSIEKPLEGLDSAELFQSAMGEEPGGGTGTEPAQPATEVQPQDGQPRDEHGRFAPKAADAPEQPPVQAEQPQATQQPPEDQQAAIPSWRLKEVADERRAAVQRAEQAETAARHYAAQLQQMQAELQKLRQPAEPPDFFANPEQATQAVVRSTMDPVVQQLLPLQTKLSQMEAIIELGADKVRAAQKAFDEAVANRTIAPGDYHWVQGSPNCFAAAVEWHQRQKVMSTVGPDPEAWFTKRLDTWMADPKNQAAALERIRGQASNNGSRQPTVQLPPSLARTPGTAANVPDDPGDMSDASLFAQAMR